MSLSSIEIGGTPTDEACARIGVTENAQSLNRLECKAYIEALRRRYGLEPEGAELRLKSNPHDYGTYYEVICRFDFEIEAARAYAFAAENGVATWAEVGMWAPVRYDDRYQPAHVLRNPGSWDMNANPECHEVEPDAPEEGDTVVAKPARYWVGNSQPTTCDVCNQELGERMVDGRTINGPWATMDLACHGRIGVGLGVGDGQLYEKQADGRWLKIGEDQL